MVRPAEHMEMDVRHVLSCFLAVIYKKITAGDSVRVI